MGKSLKMLQGLLWFICAFHIVVGAGINFSPGITKAMANFYGAQVDWTPQFVYILKPLGAFMFVLGILAVSAARDPLGNPAIVKGFIALFVIRAVQRPLFGREIYEAFAIPPARNLTTMALFLALAACLVLLFRSAQKAKRLTEASVNK